MAVFQWDDVNIAHIAEHRVTPKEAQEVVLSATRPFPQAIGINKFLVRGQSRAGRYLQVIYVTRDVATIDMDPLDPEDRLNVNEVDEVQYVIRARDLTPGEKRTIRRR